MIFLSVPVWLYMIFRRRRKFNSEWASLFTVAVLVLGVVAIRHGIDAIPNTRLARVDQRFQQEIQAEALPEALRKYGQQK